MLFRCKHVFRAATLSLLVVARFASASVHANSATFRTSDGVSLHYFDAGSGAAIVFIPGWTMSADIFEPQINQLSQRFRVIVLDPRSQGDSEKTPDGNSLERHAKDIKELLEHLQPQSVVLLGWSNGVPDVLTYVDQYGDASLRGVILVDGMIKISDPEILTAVNGMLKAFQADRRKFMDGFVRGMYSSKQSEEYIAHVEEQSLKTPTNTAITEMYNVLSKADFTPALAKLEKPVLYICQGQMEFQGKLLKASLPRAQVEVMKNVAHALFVDDPARFNQKVTEFMDTLPRVTVKPSLPGNGL